MLVITHLQKRSLMITKTKFFLLAVFMVLSGLTHALEIPEKHEKDLREYRRFTLDNGLKVLLVSDPDMNKSAASMAVGVGSLGDPRERQGLAHYLEHMLFLGTKKFPEEGEYSRYLKSNGGYSNAYTAGDHTNYHFQIHHAALEGALDRFAQFFIAPLFSPEFTDREIQAVHNEHQKNLKNDGWREYFLMNRFFIKEHPAHHFGTGNSETLKGIDRNELLSFYEQHYSSNTMTLALLSNKSLDSLEAMVKTYFKEIPNRKLKPIEYPEKYMETSDKIRMVTMKPVKDMRSLKLMFALPGVNDYFLSKPGQLMGFILGHEGKGSLLSLLKKENLALGLGAGSYASTPDYASFSISVTLTEKGAEEVERVAEYCFAAIKMLKNIGYQDHIFDEVQTMNRLNKVYSPKGEGTGLAMGLTSNMLKYPLEYAENIKWSLEKKDPEAYQKLLSYLEPKNCMLLLIKTGAQTDSIEPIYGTEYSFSENADLFKKLTEVELHPEIKAPMKNPFLPDEATPLVEQPIKLIDEAGLSFWYSQDVEFKRPKAQLLTRLRFPADKVNLEFVTKLGLFTTLINEQLNEWAYPASQAGLNYRLRTDSESEGLELVVGGYNSGIPKLLGQILDEIKTVHISKDRFTSIKNQTQRSLKNFKKEIAYQQARVMSRKLNRETYYSPSEKLSVMEKLTYEDLVAFPKELFTKLYMESLLHGNMRASEAVKLVHQMKSSLIKEALPKEAVKEQKYLEQSLAKVSVAEVLETNNDCLRKDYFLGKDSPKMRMISQILNNFIEQPFYTEMRTRQQLGYIVWGGTAASPVDHFLIFIIQSGTHDVLDVQKRANEFIPSLAESFSKLDEKAFEGMKHAIEAKLKEKYKSIGAKASSFFNSAFKEKEEFNRQFIDLKALREVTKAEVEGALKKALNKDTAKIQELLLFAEGKHIPEELKPTLNNVNELRKSSKYRAK